MLFARFPRSMHTVINGRQEKQKIQEATSEEKIAMLEQRRGQLVKQKFDLDIKLADLHARMTGVPRAKQDEDRPRARDLF